MTRWKANRKDFLHSERLARASCYARNRSTFVYGCGTPRIPIAAFRATNLVDDCFRTQLSWLLCRVNKLLSRLFCWVRLQITVMSNGAPIKCSERSERELRATRAVSNCRRLVGGMKKVRTSPG